MSKADFPIHDLIFHEGEGDGMESRLSSYIFFTLIALTFLMHDISGIGGL